MISYIIQEYKGVIQKSNNLRILIFLSSKNAIDKSKES